jgi:hypothetical protein
MDPLEHRNQDPKPLVRTASVESVLANLRGCTSRQLGVAVEDRDLRARGRP